VGTSAPFRITRNELLLALISVAFAGEASAAAGRVDFATDGATVSGANGQHRPLSRGAELDKGDTIRTDSSARAQIRFADGAYISLQPNTEFSIKDYSFDGKADGTERGFFALAKGAMRTVTGLIGRVNKNRYQISTPTATIGIRGTGGLITVLNDGSTLVTGTSGIWTITNPAGTIDVPAGVTGKAPAAPNQPPQQTSEKPSTGPTQPTTTQQPYTQADNRAPDGTSAAVATPPIIPLPTGAGYGAAVAYTPSSTFFGSANAATNLDAVFTDAGQLTNAQTNPPSFGFGFKLVDGTHSEFGTDGIVAWGRWIGSVTQNCDCSNPQIYGADQGLHYVVGLPTPVLPTSGTANYGLAVGTNFTGNNNVAGATSPTFVDGRSAPGTFTLNNLSVNFGATTTVALNFNVTMGAAGVGYNVDAPGTATSAKITFTPTVTPTTAASCTGNGCSGTVQGMFFGTSAERIGVGYSIFDNGLFVSVNGAAAFKKQ
jgi:hypothetical protein